MPQSRRSCTELSTMQASIEDVFALAHVAACFCAQLAAFTQSEILMPQETLTYKHDNDI